MQTLPESIETAGITSFPIPPRILRRVLYALLIALPGCAIPLAFAGKLFPSGLLIANALVIVAATVSLQRGKVRLAAWLILLPLAVCVTVLILAGKGPLDEAVLTIPGLLIFASLFGNRRVFMGILLFFAALLAALGIAHVQGLHRVPAALPRGDTFITVLTILTVTAYFVWLMARTLHTALRNLRIENQRVRRSLARIEVLAHHDALTGLPNRSLARDRFEQAAAQATRNNSGAALLYLDLDNFKTVNDSLGHAAGDALLCDVAARLASAVRSNDTVSRQGGDEFLIVLGDVTDEDAVAAIALKLVEKMALPFRVNGLAVTATCSLGIALFPGNGPDFESLLKRADQAMYQAKESGRNAFRFFEERMNTNVAEHLHLLSAMRAALSKHEFSLHYQPQFALGSQRIVGAEALLRWSHPEHGPISPAQFVPLAERSGLIVEIGAWVFQEACRQAARWREAGLADLTISVNVSPVQLRRPGFEAMVRDALKAAQLPASCMGLELTESLLLADSTALRELLARLRAMGLHLSIDDFGTGYSSLSYLKSFDVERLKIDQSFVKKMTSSTDDAGIVKAIVQIASSLGLEAVAEGIEDVETLDRLVELGCGFGQGFHWAAGMPAAEFLGYVKKAG